MAKYQPKVKRQKTGDLNAWQKARKTKSEIFALGAIGGLTGELISGAVLLSSFVKKMATAKKQEEIQNNVTPPAVESIPEVVPTTQEHRMGSDASAAALKPHTPEPVSVIPEEIPPEKPRGPSKKLLDELSAAYLGKKYNKINDAKERDTIHNLATKLDDPYAEEEQKEEKKRSSTGVNKNYGDSSNVERILKDNTLILKNIDKNVEHFDKAFIEYLNNQGSEINQDESLAEKRKNEFIEKNGSHVERISSDKKEEGKKSSLLDDYFKISLTKLAAQWGLKAGKALLGLFTSTLTKALSGTFLELGEGLIAGITAPVTALVVAAIGAAVATKVQINNLQKRSDSENIKRLRETIKKREIEGEKFDTIQKDLLSQKDESGKSLFTQDDITKAATNSNSDVEPGTSEDLSKGISQITPLGEVKLDTSALTGAIKTPQNKSVSFQEQQDNAERRAAQEREDNGENLPGVSFEEQQANAQRRAGAESESTSESKIEQISPPITTLNPIDQGAAALPSIPEKLVSAQQNKLITTLSSSPKPISANVETVPSSETQGKKKIKYKQNTVPQEIAEMAIATEKKYGVPASVTIGQWAIETGWGLRTPGNNAFGMMKAARHTMSQFLMTTEDMTPEEFTHLKPEEAKTATELDGSPLKLGWKGKKKFKIKREFAEYKTLQDSFDDHAKLLSSGTPYKKAFENYKKTGDVNQFIKDIAPTYGSGRNYSDTLEKVTNQENVKTALNLPPTPILKETSAIEMLQNNPQTGISVRNNSATNEAGKAASNQKPIIIPMPATQTTASNGSNSSTMVIAMTPRNSEDTFNRANDLSWRRT